MPNFKDTYSSQDNYNTRKSINFHSNRDLNDTESIAEEAINFCTSSSDGICFCMYMLLFCIIFIGVCVCYYTIPNKEEMSRSYKNYNQRRRKSSVTNTALYSKI